MGTALLSTDNRRVVLRPILMPSFRREPGGDITPSLNLTKTIRTGGLSEDRLAWREWLGSSMPPLLRRAGPRPPRQTSGDRGPPLRKEIRSPVASRLPLRQGLRQDRRLR